MVTRNSIGQDFLPNADGFTLTGGVTARSVSVTGGNVSVTASGNNTYTFPSTNDTLVGRASNDTLTNKSISATTNTLTGIVKGATNSGSATLTMWWGTAAQYAAIGSKDSNTIYYVKD